MAIHQSWTGSISFGLVTIPVKLYSTSENKEFSFNQLCPNGHKIIYKRWCPVEGKEIPYGQIKKGYKAGKEGYIVFEKNDLDKIKLKTTKSIDIREFVDATELDPSIHYHFWLTRIQVKNTCQGDCAVNNIDNAVTRRVI